MNGSPARISSRRLRLGRFAISPLHRRRTVGSLAALRGAVSRRRGAFDLGRERVGQFDFGGRGAPPGNMDAEAGEPVELKSEAARKVRRQQGGRDGDDCEASAGRAIA